MEQMYNVFNSQTFDVINQLVGTCTEMIQGPCKGNQLSFVKAKIIDSSREYMSGFEKESEIFPLGFEGDDDLESIGDFKFSIVTLLTSLLEGEIDEEIIGRMAGSLDFNQMKVRL
jgi:hypothetical protein